MNETKRFLINNQEHIEKFIDLTFKDIRNLLILIPKDEWISYDRNVAIIGKFLFELSKSYENNNKNNVTQKTLMSLNHVFMIMQPLWADMIVSAQQNIVMATLKGGVKNEEE